MIDEAEKPTTVKRVTYTGRLIDGDRVPLLGSITPPPMGST